MQHITYEAMAGKLSWTGAVAAMEAGHRAPKAQVGDLFLGPSEAVLLNRGAYIEGLGWGVKAVTVLEGNAAKGLPSIQGAMFLFAPEDGSLRAIIESRLVTERKTAGDSVLGAKLLARPDSETLLIVGGGVVAASLVRAYSEIFPALKKIMVWTRRPEAAEAFATEQRAAGYPVEAAPDLPAAAARADIISSATMARSPVLHGEWIRPGTHVDLIGAFKADMREADDALIAAAKLFVDSRATTIHHIGELMIPIAAGVIGEDHVKADLYDLIAGGAEGRASEDEITLFKNGGGAHLDLMTARWIAEAAEG